MIADLKYHSGKLFGTWAIGTVTWVTDATSVIGFLGACAGAVAGIMLVIIRWDDFVQSSVVKRLIRWRRSR